MVKEHNGTITGAVLNKNLSFIHSIKKTNSLLIQESFQNSDSSMNENCSFLGHLSKWPHKMSRDIRPYSGKDSAQWTFPANWATNHDD